jgi:AcrR family transcriptional regulator
MSPQSADQRRVQVLDAAVEAFATAGLQGATTAGIAAAAGISQPYVMHLFGSKKGLFLAVLDEGTRRLAALLDEAPPSTGVDDPVAVISAGYDRLIREHPSLMRLQLQSWAAATTDPEIRDACAAHFRSLWESAAGHLGLTRGDTAPLMASLTFFNVVVALGLQQDDDCAVAPMMARILGGEDTPGDPQSR